MIRNIFYFHCIDHDVLFHLIILMWLQISSDGCMHCTQEEELRLLFFLPLFSKSSSFLFLNVPDRTGTPSVELNTKDWSQSTMQCYRRTPNSYRRGLRYQVRWISWTLLTLNSGKRSRNLRLRLVRDWELLSFLFQMRNWYCIALGVRITMTEFSSWVNSQTCLWSKYHQIHERNLSKWSHNDDNCVCENCVTHLGEIKNFDSTYLVVPVTWTIYFNSMPLKTLFFFYLRRFNLW